MTSEDPPVSPPSSESLQFEHADFTAAPAAPALACAACRQPIAGAYYEVNGKTLCAGCRDRIAAHFTGGSGVSRFVRAVLLGSLAALGGTLLYYLVLAVTGYEIGLIAILVGFMVGAAVRKGTRNRGGLVYQLLAVFLTYTSIVSAYVPVMVAELVKQRKAAPAPAAPAAAAADPAPAVAKEVDKDKDKDEAEEKREEPAPAAAKAEAPAPAPAPAADKAAAPVPGVGKLLLLLVILLALVYASPFLAGAQNLIGLVIIFFGLLQAWRMNRKVNLAINGPFQVTGGVPPPQELPAHG